MMIVMIVMIVMLEIMSTILGDSSQEVCCGVACHDSVSTSISPVTPTVHPCTWGYA